MAGGSPRALWKGAISFGLVHVPVALHAASQEQEVDFDWLDARTLDPVGYKRINKRTGKEIAREHIVKGVKLAGDEVVVLSDDEIRAAYPKRTQTIQIEQFVKAEDVSFVYLEKPYYLAPDDRAEHVYALLREALAASAVIGIARFVLHNKEHLAALVPAGPALMLGTLRWADEIRAADSLGLPRAGADDPKPAELKMARQLVEQMTGDWRPQDFKDDFATAIRTLVQRKARAGDKATVQALEEAPDLKGADVVDLTDLLRQSLRGGQRERPATRKTARKKAA
ncbi:Ku protein [Pelomonas cellulosilytica]|uniref:Non-homologous end joining protein Ku n=1 Tax=Pelomonas cellulosilytica TaxID=2906762 RepID=A0ABS8XRY5_9BURK|nr:Ku protein [Pelomonas sp. P8]MCE4555482.1 Ku protein [Pelomonas sp. P8]